MKKLSNVVDAAIVAADHLGSAYAVLASGAVR